MGKAFSPILAAFAVILIAFWVIPIEARTSQTRQNNAVAQALYAAQATQRRAALIADERAQTLRRRVGLLETELANARREAAGAARRADQLAASSRENARVASVQTAEASRLNEEVDRISGELALAQESFVQRLSEQDAQYRREIAAFRDAASDIASSPEGVEALERFNEGDWAAARDILDKLNAARDKAEDIVRAARYRSTVAFFREAHFQGKEELATVASRYEEIVKLDPGHYWDWLWLRLFYTSMGKFTDAVRASEQARAVAEKPALAIVLLAEEPYLRRRAGLRVGDEEQLAQIGQALSEIRRARRSNPDDAETRGAHRFVLIALVRVHQRRREWQESSQRLNELGRLIANDNTSITMPKEFENSEGFFHELLYVQARNEDDLLAAKSHIEYAIKLNKKRAEKDPKNLQIAAQRARRLTYKLSLERDLEQREDAIATFGRLEELVPSLKQPFLHEASARTDVVRELIQTVDWIKKDHSAWPQGDWSLAVIVAAEQVARFSYSKNTDDPIAVSWLAQSLRYLGRAEYQNGKFPEAERYFDESVRLVKLYASIKSKDPTAQRFAWDVMRTRAQFSGDDDERYWDDVADAIQLWRQTPIGRQSFTFWDDYLLYEARSKGSTRPQEATNDDGEGNSQLNTATDETLRAF